MKNDVKVLTLSVLSEHVQKKTGIDAGRIKKTTNQLFDLIAKETSENESFKLQGFGTFKKIFVAASAGRNPQTHAAIEIPSHYKVKFTPAPSFATVINKPYADLKPILLSEDMSAEEKKNKSETPLIKSRPVKKSDVMPVIPEPVLQTDKIQKAAAPEPAAPVQVEPSGERVSHTVMNQTVQHAVIEHQIIRQQIVQQQIINQPIIPDGGVKNKDKEFNHDYDTDDDDDERYVNRCWFFTGIAVVLTVLVLVMFVLILIHGKGIRAEVRQTAVKPAVEKESAPQSHPEGLKTAADDNVYAALAESQYGERSLWPYIFSANMLRYPDPDKPGAVKKLVIPAKPDMAIDRKDIEFSVIDVYDAYRTLIAKQPEGKAAAVRRKHAVTALLCGESVSTDFIDTYAARFERTDVKTARELIQKK
jgi:nucleoid DNA-binding protein